MLLAKLHLILLKEKFLLLIWKITKKRVDKEYHAIVARTPSVGKMKDNMFVMTMYAGAFLIALYKEAKTYMTDDLLTRLVKETSYSPLMVKANQNGQETISMNIQ